MSEQKWKVGDLAYVSGDYNRRGGGVFTVAKVGRKWFTIEGRQGRQFDLTTGKENSDGAGGYCYARTSEEHARWEARSVIISRIRKTQQMGHSGSWERWPLERLRRLVELLEETDTEVRHG